MRAGLLAVFAATAVIFSGQPATAQLLPRDLDQTTVDVFRLLRPEYTPPDVAIGPIFLSSSISLALPGNGQRPLGQPAWPPLTTPNFTETATYDDNIFAREKLQVADMINTTTEAAEFEWDQGNDFIVGSLYAAEQRYISHPSEDGNAFLGQVAGRIELQPNGYLQFVGSMTQQPQLRGSPEANINEVVRPVYNNPYGLVSYAQDGTQFTGEVQYQIQDTAYLDQVDDFRDVLQQTMSGYISYHPTDYGTLIVTPSYQITDWQVNSDILNSTTLGITGGVRYEIPTLFKGYILIGFQKQQFVNLDFRPLYEPTLDAALIWNITPSTSILLSAQRNTMTSITNCGNDCTIQPPKGSSAPPINLFDGADEYISTDLSIGVEHEFWHNLLADQKVNFMHNQFTALAPTLVQNTYQLSTNIRYLVNQYGEVDLSYNFTGRTANFPFVTVFNTGPYAESVLSLTLKVGL